MSVLLLNATYEAMRVVTLRRAISLVLSGKAEMIEAGDGEIRSASDSFRARSDPAALLRQAALQHSSAVEQAHAGGT